MEEFDITKQVMQYFDVHSGRYGGRTYERFKDILIFLENNVKTGTVLDVGCGKGEFLNLTKNLGYSCVGLDLSKNMLVNAKKNVSDLVQGTALHLPFKPEVFDVVYMDTLLHHVVGYTWEHTIHLQNNVIKEALRVLKKDGYLIIQELYFNFIVEDFNKLLFYYLKIANKLGLPPIPGEPRGVIIAVRSKEGWNKFISDINDLKILLEQKHPHTINFSKKIVGVKEIGNIIFYTKKLR